MPYIVVGITRALVLNLRHSNDFRGHYAIHARAVLKENIPATSHSEIDYEEEKSKPQLLETAKR